MIRLRQLNSALKIRFSAARCYIQASSLALMLQSDFVSLQNLLQALNRQYMSILNMYYYLGKTKRVNNERVLITVDPILLLPLPCAAVSN
jgi:hypothetical protein